MSKKMTGKERAYQLFNEGKAVSSPEVKALGLKASTRYSYHTIWEKAGRPASAPGTPPASETKKKERVVSELAMITKPTGEVKEIEAEGEEEEAEGEEPEGSELKQKPKEKPTDGKKSPATMVAGQGLTFAVTVSTKTLMLYQIAASQQEDELTLGDFIDGCVQDVYQGRGFDLGLIKIGGA